MENFLSISSNNKGNTLLAQLQKGSFRHSRPEVVDGWIDVISIQPCENLVGIRGEGQRREGVREG